MKRLLVSLLLPLFISACGSDSDNSPVEQAEFPRTLNLGSEYVATLNMSEVKNGIADLTVNIETTDGSSLEGQAIRLSPLMKMVGGMQHGTPFENGAGTLNASGSFTSTAYFLMPSNMPNGNPMGNWSINIEFDGKTITAPITVEMNGLMKTLKGGDTDQVMNMTDANSTLDRTYYIYNRGRHINAEMNMNMFEVYVAARETMMDYQAVQVGNVLNEGAMMHELTINNVLVEMCVKDCELEVSWITADLKNNHAGIYQGKDLGLTGNDTDMVMVRLTVNDEVKDNGAKENAKTSVMFKFDNSDTSSSHSHM